ncbi:Putative LysR-family transcriptional regulator YidZ [Salmonella enterica subsp. enterica serovar Madelia]|nr:Putative LysR-family transcriptional regulator YidZ [Salmonella enterica subsp. enterica serovar Madelia]
MKKSLTNLDLNLLLCLQLLMQERSVTKAAKRMNVTPSAVSKSLAKLRAWFDDPLFVNTPLGLAPTPLMVSMEQSLADWMQMGNQLLDKPHHQTPRGLKFELAAESPLMMIMFNSLSQQIYQRYPQATIKVRNWIMTRWRRLRAGKSISDLPDAKAIPARENCSVCCRSRLILRYCLAICRGLAAGRSSGTA